MSKATRIAPGEYEYKNHTISKDEYESNLWWVRRDGFTVAEDFTTLKDAKQMIDKSQTESL